MAKFCRPEAVKGASAHGRFGCGQRLRGHGGLSIDSQERQEGLDCSKSSARGKSLWGRVRDDTADLAVGAKRGWRGKGGFRDPTGSGS